MQHPRQNPFHRNAGAIVVVEDNAGLRRLLGEGLRRAGHEVATFGTAEEAARHLDRTQADVVLLDIGLPGRDGLAMIRALRASAFEGAVICVSGLATVPHRVAALEAGADDYLVKPFSFDELQARVRARLRRRPGQPGGRLHHGGLTIDLRRHVALWEGADLGLSQKELHLLTLFAERPGQVLARGYLLSEVWGAEGEGRANLLDVAIRRLREKLAAGGGVVALRTLRGQGYRLD